MTENTQVADAQAKIEVDRAVRNDAQVESDKIQADALRAQIAELEGHMADRSEVQVLQARLAQLKYFAPHPDAATEAQLAQNVRDAIAAEQEFRTRRTTQQIDPATGLVVTEEQREQKAKADEAAAAKAAKAQPKAKDTA